MSSTQNILYRYEQSNVNHGNKFNDAVDAYLTQPEQEDEISIYYSRFANKGTDAIRTMTGFYISKAFG